MTFIKNFLKDEDGASAVEYAILVGLVAVAIAAGVQLLGTAVDTKIDAATTAVNK
ncbi:MAG: Flp family type IVb pilin [Burkholderiales bacterium]|jgi:pilus assembly protein Flp/PilA